METRSQAVAKARRIAALWFTSGKVPVHLLQDLNLVANGVRYRIDMAPPSSRMPSLPQGGCLLYVS